MFRCSTQTANTSTIFTTKEIPLQIFRIENSQLKTVYWRPMWISLHRTTNWVFQIVIFSCTRRSLRMSKTATQIFMGVLNAALDTAEFLLKSKTFFSFKIANRFLTVKILSILGWGLCLAKLPTLLVRFNFHCIQWSFSWLATNALLLTVCLFMQRTSAL